MPASRSPRGRTYEGQRISVRWDAARCIHAAECVKRQPAVFDSKRKPWIEPDSGDPDEIARAVAHCPTGALHFERTDGGPVEEISRYARVELKQDGPLYVRGDLRIQPGPDAQEVAEVRAAFCRCGASENKPYCDGKHSKIHFRAPGQLPEAAAPDRAPEPDPEGLLRFQPMTNGPLMVRGVFAIVDGAGAAAGTFEKGALCRCGASARKPFCDGSHTASGFEG